MLFYFVKVLDWEIKVLIKKRLRHPEKAKVNVQVPLPKPPWLRVKAPAGKIFSQTKGEISAQ